MRFIFVYVRIKRLQKAKRAREWVKGWSFCIVATEKAASQAVYMKF